MAFNERPSHCPKGNTMIEFALAVAAFLLVGIVFNVIGHYVSK